MLPPVGLLVPFLVASVLVTVVPGADMALVTRQVLLGGTGLAQRTVFGNLAGLLVHGVALAGSRRCAPPGAFVPAPRACPRCRHAGRSCRGLISAVFNPKPALFFLMFLPRFVDRHRPVLPRTLTLTAVHVLIGLVWLSAYARVVHRARAVLTAPRVRAWVQRTTGVVLIAFGVRLAIERR
ncbi:MAG: LysE family translocator [Pseudonocardia sp.]|nr:LysE family translocator [Pseudonocardia sp.]